jgi:hypothetical protein
MSETSTEEELKMDFPMVPEFVGTGAADENIQERIEFEGWLSIGSIVSNFDPLHGRDGRKE